MGAIYKRELRSYITGVTGPIFVAFLLLMIGIFTTAVNLLGRYPSFENALSSTVFIFMIAGASVFPIYTAMHGTVIMSQLVCAYIGFFAWGAMFIAIGMLVSSFTENSIIAAVLGEIVMFMFLFIDNFSQTDFIAQYPKLQSFLYAFAAQPRFAYFSQGFIRLSDLVFFLSAIIICLAWNYIAIERRRWKRG